MGSNGKYDIGKFSMLRFDFKEWQSYDGMADDVRQFCAQPLTQGAEKKNDWKVDNSIEGYDEQEKKLQLKFIRNFTGSDAGDITLESDKVYEYRLAAGVMDSASDTNVNKITVSSPE